MQTTKAIASMDNLISRFELMKMNITVFLETCFSKWAYQTFGTSFIQLTQIQTLNIGGHGFTFLDSQFSSSPSGRSLGASLISNITRTPIILVWNGFKTIISTTFKNKLNTTICRARKNTMEPVRQMSLSRLLYYSVFSFTTFLDGFRDYLLFPHLV